MAKKKAPEPEMAESKAKEFYEMHYRRPGSSRWHWLDEGFVDEFVDAHPDWMFRVQRHSDGSLVAGPLVGRNMGLLTRWVQDGLNQVR
jgi:hypothetical protein